MESREVFDLLNRYNATLTYNWEKWVGRTAAKNHLDDVSKDPINRGDTYFAQDQYSRNPFRCSWNNMVKKLSALKTPEFMKETDALLAKGNEACLEMMRRCHEQMLTPKVKE